MSQSANILNENFGWPVFGQFEGKTIVDFKDRPSAVLQQLSTSMYARLDVVCVQVILIQLVL